MLSPVLRYLLELTASIVFVVPMALASPADEPAPIKYIQPDIPVVNVPTYDGERYTATVPDTLDLAERAALAVNGLTGPLDPKADYELYWIAQFHRNLPIMMHDFNDHCQIKFQEALPLMRLASGSRQHDEVDKRWMEVVMQMQGPDGLLYYPVQGRPWVKKNVFLTQTGGRAPITNHFTEPIANGRLLAAIALYYKTTGDARWKEVGEKIVDGLRKLAIYRDDYAYFAKGVYDVGELSDPKSPPPEPWTGVMCGWIALGLTQFHNATGYEPALILSGKLARFVQLHDGAFQPDGRFVDLLQNQDIHFHGHTGLLLGILEYGIAARDREMIEFARKGYEFGLRHVEPTVGFAPEVIAPQATCETCGVADMIHLAIKLTLAGEGDHWDDVDRWTRNQFAENQLASADWVEPMVKGLPASPGPVGPEATIDRVPERCVGGFAGWATANDWLGSNPGNYAIQACCTGNGTRAVYYVWENILHCRDGKMRVNLLLNRASPWADVDSYIPYEGRVDIRIKMTCELSLRIPEWVKPDQTKCTVNGADRNLSWQGRYAIVGKVESNDVATLTFPIFERADKVTIQGKDYTIIRKGNDVVHIDPPGKYCPLYQREKYRKNAARTKKVERFVAKQQIEW